MPFYERYIKDFGFIPIDKLTDKTNKYHVLNYKPILIPESNFIYSNKNKLFFGNKSLQIDEKKLINEHHFPEGKEENSRSLVQRI
jgi:hypothetical protein